ncbi:hypothetical protein GDO86_001792 [Hymenochirus boettgeri]|uniref:Tankyrase 1-binding protein C-terminal domain-containing protein n=1 Tax=Hymenochirus boettgeri TaxID=247094 RepID=A0A8T2KE76_9PIPI|nr:hypothetical protein GDO86_001792 [Hymenochirus boettgeri]
MEYLGDKLTVAHTHVNQWMGTMRRSLHEALSLVTTAVTHERSGGEQGTRNPLKRTSSFRHFASRSRESFRRFSVRSQQRFSSLRKRHTAGDQADPEQLKQCVTRFSTVNKDTDSLVQETERQYGTRSQEEQLQCEDRFASDLSTYVDSRKQLPQSRLSSVSQSETEHDSITDQQNTRLDLSSMDTDSTDGIENILSAHESIASDFSFIDQTSVLDSTAQKNRVHLSRKSQRRAPSQSQRRSRLLQPSSQLAVIKDTDSPWMYTDSTSLTEDKPEKEETDEERPQKTPVQQQRMSMFPVIDPSALKAQLRKRQEPESNSDSPSQPSRSPKSPLSQGALGVKLLPTSADKQDRGTEESPAWLKELKSKKRQSQYENNT